MLVYVLPSAGTSFSQRRCWQAFELPLSKIREGQYRPRRETQTFSQASPPEARRDCALPLWHRYVPGCGHRFWPDKARDRRAAGGRGRPGTRACFAHSGANRQSDDPIARRSNVEAGDGGTNPFRLHSRDILRFPHQQYDKFVSTVEQPSLGLMVNCSRTARTLKEAP